MKYIQSELPECFSHKRVEPQLSSAEAIDLSDPAVHTTFEEMAWIICHSQRNNEYTVPQWADWVSKTALCTSAVKQSVIVSCLQSSIP